MPDIHAYIEAELADARKWQELADINRDVNGYCRQAGRIEALLSLKAWLVGNACAELEPPIKVVIAGAEPVY